MKMKLRKMEDTNRTPGWHARSTDYPCQAWAPMTEGTRALPPTQIKFTLRHEDDYWVWESGYTAVLETFTETAKYVPDVGTVYMCEATYTYEGDCTSKAKQWKV